MLKERIGALRGGTMPGTLTDPEVFLYATWVSVWGRWFVWLVGVILTVYRFDLWFPEYSEYLPVPVLLALANGLVHFRLVRKRYVTWRWMLFLGAADTVLITYAIIVGNGFNSFIFLAYYPALAIFAVVMSSFWLSFAWTTLAAAAYTIVCLTVGSGLDLDAGNEKELVARLTVMYTVVLGISFIIRFERFRWQTSVARERQLRRERVNISQRIHDTTAQTAYMIGLGIHRARELAGESNKELASTLDTTLELSKSVMWEMRGPIDAGHIVEGRELGRVLWSHCETFDRITGIPVEMNQLGTEPPLATETRSSLFTIAHNALTNTFLHAHPSRVEVTLSFENDQTRLSITDDGVGLPDDYRGRGRGFSGMKAEAEHVGGTLIIESRGDGIGTTITCVVPGRGDKGEF